MSQYEQGQPPYYNAAPAGPVPLTPGQDKTWAALCHFGGIFSPLPALIIWLIFRDRGRFVDQEGKEALNFQLSALIVIIALGIVGTGTLFLGIGLILLLLVPLLELAALIFAIIGGSTALVGTPYRYPLSWRMIK
ncbi:DUF4870 domain-containing protein [Mycetocola spongiae]|uniref:DUF4870 domain-containing protein n=1 Tax=Mycetocola spongiae TaxID=2859226 RepID=UPI001CF4A537|nr:DUF4870 domain-containing protein [Mycetocola spongiae]UCR89429.1 DUF4870 domain-containing protein [Mycetocola spongiae]